MMKRMWYWTLILTFCMAVPDAQVLAQTPVATSTVQELVASAKEYADGNAPGLTNAEKDLRKENKNKISAILDLHEMAHLILARHWENLKPSDRERYASLLAALVEKIGYPQIQKFFNGKIEIEYAGENHVEGGKNIAVITKIISKEDDLTLTSEFRLHKSDGNWRIYDVITDGESLLLIYRNQHAAIIKEKGFPHLIKLMEKKLNETK